MAQGEDTSGEKVHDPTPKKLEDARKKGDIAKSSDLTVAAVYFGFFLASAISAENVISSASGLSVFLQQPDLLTGEILGAGGMQMTASILGAVLAPLFPIFMLPFALALASILGQRIFVVVPDKLKPKLNRISPIAGAKNKFGQTGLVEFLKTFIKMSTVGLIVTLYLMGAADEIIGLARADTTTVASELFKVLGDLLVVICIFAVVVGIFDLLWQKFNHQKKLRMSFQELKDEGKEAEGDPHTKSQRKQRGREIATNRMLLEVPKADVIVVNPTHYAVALSWSKKKGSAPRCVAKGEDEIAARIREIASVSGIPIHSDPPTARAIHATVKIGEEIAPEHYHAIAAALRFADTMRKKAREKGI